MIDRSLVQSTSLFRDLSGDDMDELIRHATRHEFRRGDVIFAEHDQSSQLLVVDRGRIAISRHSTHGRKSVMAIMRRGDVIGEISLFARSSRTADARALEASTVIAIENAWVRELYRRRPQLLWGVAELMADRLRATNDDMVDAVFLDVAGRTAKRLLEAAGDEAEFTLDVTQEELAGLVGASRERVNKAIANFIRLGWLDNDGRRYRILNRRQLEVRSS